MTERINLNNLHIYSGDLERILPDILTNKTYLLVTSDGWINRDLLNRLSCSGIADKQRLGIVHHIHENPTISNILSCFDNNISPDYIVAIGGGSVIDASKALSALYNLSGDINKFHKILESPDNFTFENNKLLPKIIAVPTTSGTGSEATRWATIWGDGGKKHSLSHELLYPKASILDATFCLSMPDNITLSSGLDAFSHACEAIWNNNYTSESDEYAQKALNLIINNLPKALHNPGDIIVRQNMQLAALYAGYAMSITKTALAHSISYPLTGIYGIAHGIACSITLPEIIRFNIKENTNRMQIIANIADVKLENLPEWCKQFLCDVGIVKTMCNYSSQLENINITTLNLIDKSRTDNNIRTACQKDAVYILKKSLDSFL